MKVKGNRVGGVTQSADRLRASLTKPTSPWLMALCLAFLSTPLWANSALDHLISLNIPPNTPMEQALIEWGKATGIQVMMSTPDVRLARTQGVHGTLTAAQALTALLKGSRLAYRADETTVRVVPAATLDSSKSKAPASQGKVRKDRGTTADASKADSSPTPDQSQSLEEIVVTAQKYRQSAFDVPISLAVIGESMLQKTHVSNFADLMAYVPGLTVEDTGIAVRISLRGISNLDGSGALVGNYLDDADVTTDGTVGLDLSTNDLARVEVLRGPQGTLYGEGSEGGTIRYITNKPNLTTFEMNAEVTALFDQYGAPGERVQAVINAPVVRDEIGLRVVASLDYGGGWIDQPAANLKNINSKEVTDVRIEGRWSPTSDVTADATEVIHRATIGAVTGENSDGNYTQAFSLTTTPNQVTNYNISNLTVSWQPDAVDVVNSATYISLYNVVNNMELVGQFGAPPPAPLFEVYYPVNASNAAYE